MTMSLSDIVMALQSSKLCNPILPSITGNSDSALLPLCCSSVGAQFVNQILSKL